MKQNFKVVGLIFVLILVTGVFFVLSNNLASALHP